MQQQQWAPLLVTAGVIAAALALSVQSAIGRRHEVQPATADTETRPSADVDHPIAEVAPQARPPICARAA